MGKQMKSGKKRRSPLTIKEQFEARRFVNEAILPYNLIDLFDLYNRGELKIKGERLKTDIELCMEVLPKIPHFKKTYLKNSQQEKKQRQIYKSHFQEQIAKIDSVLRRMPLYIRLDFIAYEKLLEKSNKFKTPSQLYENIGHDSRQLKKEGRLPGLRFYGYGSKLSVPAAVFTDATMDEASVRSLLTAALFDHVQRIILGDNQRFKKCVQCHKWFLSTDEAHKFHNNKCRIDYWDSIPQNKKRRLGYYDSYREKRINAGNAKEKITA